MRSTVRSTPRAVFALVLLAGGVSCATAAPVSMTQQSLARQIEEIAGSAKTSRNVVEFHYEGVGIACVSDPTHDRMRLIAPITESNSVDVDQLEIMLTANFHTTLDARYALSKGIVFAAFLHPLSTLSRAQLESAIRQVAALARNFGSSYSSDELIYGVEPGEET